MARGLDLVIFDCDGVLVDSEPVFNRVHAEILSECGYEITPELLGERFCGISDAEMLAAIEREWGKPLPPDYHDRAAALADACCAATLMSFPGIHEVLDRMPAPICVASSGTPERIRKSLGLTGLLDRFEPNIFSAVMVARGKPA
ncbi:MAG: HAD hydrolase-like protein, partial [Alphaproteobacteria bacterium]